MEDVSKKVKDIIVEQLGVNPDEITPEASLSTTWEPIRWIRLSW